MPLRKRIHMAVCGDNLLHIPGNVSTIYEFAATRLIKGTHAALHYHNWTVSQCDFWCGNAIRFYMSAHDLRSALNEGTFLFFFFKLQYCFALVQITFSINIFNMELFLQLINSRRDYTTALFCDVTLHAAVKLYMNMCACMYVSALTFSISKLCRLCNGTTRRRVETVLTAQSVVHSLCAPLTRMFLQDAACESTGTTHRVTGTLN